MLSLLRDKPPFKTALTNDYQMINLVHRFSHLVQSQSDITKGI